MIVLHYVLFVLILICTCLMSLDPWSENIPCTKLIPQMWLWWLSWASIAIGKVVFLVSSCKCNHSSQSCLSPKSGVSFQYQGHLLNHVFAKRKNYHNSCKLMWVLNLEFFSFFLLQKNNCQKWSSESCNLL